MRQRKSIYAVTDNRGDVSYFYYDKTESRNNPTKTTLTQTEKQKLAGTGSGDYGRLSPIKVAGKFDCPIRERNNMVFLEDVNLWQIKVLHFVRS